MHHVNIADHLNIMCTLVATGVTLGRYETVHIHVFEETFSYFLMAMFFHLLSYFCAHLYTLTLIMSPLLIEHLDIVT